MAEEPQQGAAEMPQHGAAQMPPPADSGGESPLGVQVEQDPFAERPEVYVGAAFAGGLALALILRRVAG